MYIRNRFYFISIEKFISRNIKLLLILFLVFIFIPSAYSQERVVITTYNLLNYPENFSVRNPEFKKIIDEIDPDILVVQEMISNLGVGIFLVEVLNPSYKSGRFIDGPDTDNAIYYKDSLFTLFGIDSIISSPRWITRYRLYHNFTGDTLIIYSAHFKAGNLPSDQSTRTTEASILRFHTDQLTPGKFFMLVGDLNLYTSAEQAYQNLLDQTNSGYFIDPINAPGNWHDNVQLAYTHTQSPRVSNPHPPEGSLGGMDDRFDFILISQAIKNAGGIDYVEGTYKAFANDGVRCCNQPINNPPNQLVNQEVADALVNASDHLPVVASFNFGVLSNTDEILTYEMNFELFQNYPNPFNPVTTIKYAVGSRQFVSLKVYDILGREVVTLLNEEKEPGIYEVEFDGVNLSSGVYIYRLTASEYSASKKLSIIK
jgi:endonuclease/exonuclease/phosphatase family metal-dependent hydrolase